MIRTLVIVLCCCTIAAEEPWPAPVSDWEAPAAGEHPRLFFRADDLPELRRRAATPAGRAILDRLRGLLHADVPLAEQCAEGEARTFTLWHGAGFGFLYRITGEQRYADLAAECARLMMAGEDDRDPRYSFARGTGGLRNGPALGAMAMAYDLAYDGWEADFRREVAAAIAGYAPSKRLSLDKLAVHSRHGPESNHFGAQIGGAALALLAVRGDPGVGDQARIERLLAENQRCFIANLTRGFGDGGYFAEHAGPGMISSDTAFVPALQAWRVAGGRDFITPRPNVPAITLIRLYELMSIGGECRLMLRHPSSYGGQAFTADSGRNGLSRGGQFAQGFGAVRPEHRAPLLHVYRTIVEPDPAARTFDTVSPYPHRAVLALVNWPLDVEPVDPATVLPRVHHDAFHRYLVFRKGWTGSDADIAVSILFGPGGRGNIGGKGRRDEPVFIWGAGGRRAYGNVPQTAVTHLAGHADGSGSVAGEGFALAVDYSGASGADAAVAMVGRTAFGDHTLRADGVTWRLVLLGGDPATPVADGRDLVIGDQRFSYADGAITMATTGAALADLPDSLPVIDDGRERPLPEPLAVRHRGPIHAGADPDPRPRDLVIGGRHPGRDGGWADLWARLATDRSVHTLTRGGAVLADLLTEAEAALDGQTPFDRVLVHCGNDEALLGHQGVYDPATFAAHYRRLLDLLAGHPATAAAEQVLLTPLVMRDAWVVGGWTRNHGQPEARCRAFAAAVRELAAERDCGLVDLYAWSDGFAPPDRDAAHNRGLIWTGGVTWEPPGHALVAARVHTALAGTEPAPPTTAHRPATGEPLARLEQAPPSPPRHVDPGVLFAVPPELLSGGDRAFLVTVDSGAAAIAGNHKTETAVQPALRLTLADGRELVLVAGEPRPREAGGEAAPFPRHGSDSIRVGYAAIGEDRPDRSIPRTATWLNAAGGRWRPVASAVPEHRRAVVLLFHCQALRDLEIAEARLQLYTGAIDQRGVFGDTARSDALVVHPLTGPDAQAIPHLATWRTRDGIHPWSGKARE